MHRRSPRGRWCGYSATPPLSRVEEIPTKTGSRLLTSPHPDVAIVDGIGGGRMPTKATNIDDVLDNLGTIIADTKRRSDPLGCFAALYRQVTLGIKRGIKDGLFDDGPRMSRFDAQFANAYFAAYEQFGKGRKAGRAWHFAFERTLS